MNRVKTGREKEVKVGSGGQRSDGREVRKQQGGGTRETLRATPALGDQEVEKLEFEAPDAAEREGGGYRRDKGHLALGRGRKEGPAKATVREDRTEDTREGKVPEWQGQATTTISDSVNGMRPHKAQAGLSA